MTTALSPDFLRQLKVGPVAHYHPAHIKVRRWIPGCAECDAQWPLSESCRGRGISTLGHLRAYWAAHGGAPRTPTPDCPACLGENRA